MITKEFQGKQLSLLGFGAMRLRTHADGTIDEDAEFILQKLGEWFAINGEAVYGFVIIDIFQRAYNLTHSENICSNLVKLQRFNYIIEIKYIKICFFDI